MPLEKILNLDSDSWDNLFANNPDLRIDKEQEKESNDNDDSQNEDDLTTFAFTEKNRSGVYKSLDEIEHQIFSGEEELETTPKTTSKKEPVVENKKEEELEVVPEVPNTETQPTNEELEEVDGDTYKELLKNVVKLRVEKGRWFEWEGWENEDWDDEKFADMELQQADFVVEQRLEDAKQNSDFVKAVLEIQENGGNIDQMIDLFVQQKSAQTTFDLNTDDGKKGFIIDYHVNVLGQKRERVEKLVDMETEEGNLDNFFTEIKEKHENHYKKEQEKLIAQQREIQQRELEYKEQVQKAFVQEIKAQKLSPKLEAQYLSFINDPVGSYKGQQITGLERQYILAQRDPKKLLKLSMFLEDMEKYDEMVSTVKKNNVVASTFKAITNAKPRSHEPPAKVENKKTEFNSNIFYK